MRALLIFLALVVSTVAQADCTLNFLAPAEVDISLGFLGKKSHRKMVRILEKKGYVVSTDPASMETSEYVLDVGTYFGYDCGTGLTWVDYLRIPAFFTVKLSRNHGNVLFSRERDYVLPVVVGGGRMIPRRGLFRAIRAIPTCKSVP